MRDKLGRVANETHYPDQSSLGRGKPATAKGLSTHPRMALATGSTAAAADWSHGPSGMIISIFSITSSAGSGQREENGQLAWRKFSASLANPKRKKVPWSIPCSGIEGRAALAVPLHCTSPIPAVTTLYLCAPTSGHFLPTLFSPPAGNKYALLFWLILCAHSYY